MVRKEFTYRGKSWEELESMSISEIAELFPSRQRRSLKRGLNDAEKIFLKELKKKPNGIRTHLREMIVLPEMIGKKIMIYNGKQFVEVIMEKEMIGHYLGEFSPTRQRLQHSAPGIGATKSSGSLSVR